MFNSVANSDQSLNFNRFQTPAQKRDGSKTPHKVINLSMASKQPPAPQFNRTHLKANQLIYSSLEQSRERKKVQSVDMF